MAATIPPQSVPVVDLATGRMATPWYQFLQDLPPRLGGSANLTLSVSSTKVTFTYQPPRTAADPTPVAKTGSVTLS